MGQEISGEYQLVLEEVDLSDSDLLTRVKGILVANLDLTVPDVKNILENLPITVKNSKDENDLIGPFESLKQAGAKVLLLKPSPAKRSNANDSSAEIIEFEIDLDDNDPSIHQKDIVENHAYALDLDQESSSLEVLNEILGGQSEPREAPVSPEMKSSALTKAAEDFELQIMPAADAMELIDPDQRTADLDENGEWGISTLSSALNEEGKKAPVATAPSESVTKSDLAQEDFLELEEAPNAVITPNPPPKNSAASGAKVEPPGKPLAANSAEKKSEGHPAEPEKSKNLAPPSTPVSLELEPAAITEESSAPTATEARHMASENITAAPANQTSEAGKTTEPASLKVDHEEPAKPEPKANLESPPVNKSEETANEIPIMPAAKVAAKPGKIKSKKGASPNKRQELILITLICIMSGLVLAAINWFVINSKEEAQLTPIDDDALVAATMPQNRAVLTKAPEAKFFYGGEIVRDQYLAKASFSSDGEQIISFSLELSGTSPIPLTPEEIVNGVLPHPWFRKYELAEATFIKKEPGKFISETTGKAYVERGDLRNRHIVPTQLELTYNEGATAPALNFVLALNLENQESLPSDGIVFSVAPDGQMSLRISDLINMTPHQPPEKPAENSN